jgi:transposase
VVTLGELVMILDLARQGLSVSAIARRTGRDRKTIRTYIARGLEPPAYKPRKPALSPLAPFEAFLRERVGRFPELTGRRLWREIRDLGFGGGYATVTDFLRTVRPPAEPAAFERRFETPPGRQAQVDFAYFKLRFEDEPGAERIVWLFSMVLGHSRMMWARFVAQQDLATVLRCHVAAFTALGGVPGEILYDRMRTAVLGEVDDRGIVYNDKLLALAGHYGFVPKACRPYRAKTKGKVERPFRYVREDFFLAGRFRNLDDLNAQFTQWLDQVANRRLHGTTGRIVIEHFADERPTLKGLPAGPFNAVLRLERRISHEGMISVGGNLYSVLLSQAGRRMLQAKLARPIFGSQLKHWPEPRCRRAAGCPRCDSRQSGLVMPAGFLVDKQLESPGNPPASLGSETAKGCRRGGSARPCPHQHKCQHASCGYHRHSGRH